MAVLDTVIISDDIWKTTSGMLTQSSPTSTPLALSYHPKHRLKSAKPRDPLQLSPRPRPTHLKNHIILRPQHHELLPPFIH